ncbi:MAG: DUF1365 domain-containing protein [Planctomycetota bacterium]
MLSIKSLRFRNMSNAVNSEPPTGSQHYACNEPPLISCIYEGTVRHRRNFPKSRQFDFKLFLFFLDIDQIESIFSESTFYSSTQRSFARFLHTEHLIHCLDAGSLRQRAELTLSAHGVSTHPNKIFLLTQLRYFGFAMNPLSLFYCYDDDGILFAVIAQVNNTPWGEQHVYVIPNVKKTKSECAGSSAIRSDQVKKAFHVSPFMSLDMFYKMRFSNPGTQMSVKIENHITKSHHAIDKNKCVHNRVLDVTMLLKQVPLNGRTMNRYLWKYPLISFKAFAGIYWQAFLLYLSKKIRFYPHPGPRPTGRNSSPSDSEQSNPTNHSVSPTEAEEVLLS